MSYIRVTNYNGDFDTLHEVILIGPYPSEHAAEREVDRLMNLDGVDGGYEFELTDMESGDWNLTPYKISKVTNEIELSEAIYG